VKPRPDSEEATPEIPEAPPQPASKLRHEPSEPIPSSKLRFDDLHHGNKKSPASGKTGDAALISKTGAASFGTRGASGSTYPKPLKPTELDKLKANATNADAKLSQARAKLAGQKPPAKPGTFGMIGAAIQQEARAKVHSKISETEHENVGVEASHRVGLEVEKTWHASSHSIKRWYRNRISRRVSALTKKNVHAQSKLRLHELSTHHPSLSKGASVKQVQKKVAQKQFQKLAAKKAFDTTRRMLVAVVTAVKKVGAAVMAFVKSNPKLMLVIIILALLVISIMSCVAMVSLVANSLGGMLGATTYPPEDKEMLAAESYYAGLEVELQFILDNYEEMNPDYDAYFYYLDEIWHDPYTLISMLCVMHEGIWTFEDVRGTLDWLFSEQYLLTKSIEIELHYYMEIAVIIDPETGEEYEESYEVEYEYLICIVTLKNRNLSTLPLGLFIGQDMSQMIAYMATLGNRPDLFTLSEYPYASTEYYNHFFAILG